FPTWSGVAYYAALGPGVAAMKTRGHIRRAGLAVAIGAPVAISLGAMLMWAHQPSQASVLAVGSGQAVLLQGPRGSVLIDTGPSPAALGDGIGQLLPPWIRRLDAIVITAPTQGHVGGFAGLDRTARTVMLPAVALTGVAWRTAALEEAARGAN